MQFPLPVQYIVVVVAAGGSPGIEDHGAVFYAIVGFSHGEVHLKRAFSTDGSYVFQMGRFCGLLAKKGLHRRKEGCQGKTDKADA